MSNRINSGQSVVFGTLLSLIIAKDKTDSELAFYGTLLVAIGTNLLTISSANLLNDSYEKSQNHNKT